MSITCVYRIGPSNQTVTYEMTLEEADAYISLFNFQNLVNNYYNYNYCSDDSGSKSYYGISPQFLPQMQVHYNSVVLTSTTYSLNKELSELRALTFQDWVVISLAIVGLMALTSVFVQIKRVIR